MKRILIALFILIYTVQLHAWWAPGHFVTAYIAYERLNPRAKAAVDQYIEVLNRDYSYTNNFVAAATWPDDLKAEGVRAYNSWHYTNLPYNPQNLAIPVPPQVDILWAIEQAKNILEAPKAKDVEKARQLAFLIHFVGDIHQPLHATTYYTNELPGGNLGGNAFPIASFGRWKNLHACWDDGCGYLSSYNDIDPYGKTKEPISTAEMLRLKGLAKEITKAHPEESILGVDILDQDFWALESKKLAIAYGYKGVQSISSEGRKVYVKPNDPLSEYYLEQGQAVVQRRLATGGYRLAKLLNELFPEE